MAVKRIRRFVSILGIASQCMSDVAATEKFLGAQFDGTNFLATLQSEGSIFEIATKDSPISVARFDINIGAGTDTIKVWSRPGIPGTVVALGSLGMRVEDIGDSGWTLIKSFTDVLGQGKNNITSLPEFDVPVMVPANSGQAFYITTTYGSAVTMWYNMGSSLGNVYAMNDDIDILEGHAVGSQNGKLGWSTPRIWNGIVRYDVLGSSPATSPVPTPVTASNEPTASPVLNPSFAPTYTPDDPNLSPSSSVCQYPSSYPSLLPTAKFTSLSPSSVPSASFSHEPSESPSLEPSEEPSGLPTAIHSSAPSKSPSNQPSGTASVLPSDVPKPTRAPFSSAQTNYMASSSILAWWIVSMGMGFVFVPM